MDYIDYNTRLSNLIASCLKDIYQMFIDNDCKGISFDIDIDEATFTMYDGDGAYHERTIEFCCFKPKSEKRPYETLTLTDIDGYQYDITDMEANDLTEFYDLIYNHFYSDDE